MYKLFALTKEQERLWYEWKLDPNGHAYNTNIQFEFAGKLDVMKFKHCLNIISNHFDAFKTSFNEDRDITKQVIREQAQVELEYIDLSGITNNLEQKKAEAKSILTSRLRAPFDLTKYPLSRFCLVKVTHELHYFIYVMPHIILDGHSARMLLKGLSLLYNYGLTAFQQEFGKSSICIGDYLKYTESNFDSNKHQEAQTYWQNRLENARHIIDFGIKRKALSNKGRRIHFALDEQISEGLRKLSRKLKTTNFITIAAILNTILYRYFKQQDITIGYPVDVRPVAFKNLYGFGVNTLPLRTILSPDMEFSAFVAELTLTRKQDRKYQELSLADIVRYKRKNDKNFIGSLFNISYSQATFSLNTLKLNAINSTSLHCDYAEVNNDFSLLYDDSESNIQLAFDYKTELFTDDFVQQIINSFKFLTTEIIKDTNKKLAEYDIIDEETTENITKALSGKNNIKNTYNTIHAIFTNQAKLTPKQTALIHNDIEVSYGELDAQSYHVAQLLAKNGVRRGDFVGVCMERCPDLIATLIGILKAGAAYIPLDPTYPKERLSYIVQDCKPKIVITNNANGDKFDKDHIIALIMIEEINYAKIEAGYDILPYSDHNDIAYVIYTSGSTGKPKGTLIKHQGVVSRLLFAQDNFTLSVNDAMLQNINYSFDPSVYEIFWPLCCGAKLVLGDSKKCKDPSYIISTINKHNITILTLITSMLDVTLNYIHKNDGRSLRYVITGGEAVGKKLKDRFLQKLDAKLINFYGPTEASIITTTRQFNKADISKNNVPIGKPVNDVKLFILNEQLKIQPKGVVGELYIGGLGLAYGYLNNKKLTEEKFINSPFAKNSAYKKIYKTGDLVYLNTDDELEFVGRIDDQVKFNGYRIELKEIQKTLETIPSIQTAVVLLKQTEKEENKLVAYIVQKEQYETEYNLRIKLRSYLPEYMVPSVFINMDNIPLTTNGKVNTAALPDLPNVAGIISYTKAEPIIVAPHDIIEQELTMIWSMILNKKSDTISIHDNFFDAGGDSLLAIKLEMLLSQKFSCKFCLSDIFEHTTIAEFAAFIKNRQNITANVLPDTINDAVNSSIQKRKLFAHNRARKQAAARREIYAQ